MAEVRRITARRLVRVVMALAAVAIVAGGVLAFAKSGSMSEATYQRNHAAALSQDRAQEAAAQQCLRAHGVQPAADLSNVPRNVVESCAPKSFPTAHDPRFHRIRLADVLRGTSGVLAIVGWALGASLVGAEFASRSLTTSLTWETRRWRLFAVKATTAMVALAVLAFVILAAVAAAMLPALLLHGAPLRASDPSFAALAGLVGRGTALAALACGMGFAIASIGRNTAAALGAGFAYIVVLENILGSSFARWRRWLLLGNVIVFLTGSNRGGDVPGRTVTTAALFLGAVTATLLVAAAGAFRTRDIA
jgi:ABC-2 type transport system permease protein